MKKTVLFLIILSTLAWLTGCGAKTPELAADGASWEESWTMIGSGMGVEDPGHGFTIRDVKGAGKLFFTTWSIGEAQSYVNAEGEEGTIYDAQLTLLLEESGSAEAARTSMDDWLSMAEEVYTVIDTEQKVCNGQAFTILIYTFSAETDPYARGASAFAVRDDCAISAEFACQDDFDADAEKLLTDFLEHCHYAAQ